MALDGVFNETVWGEATPVAIPASNCSYGTGCGAVDLTASATYKTVWNANGLWIGVTVSDPGTLYSDAAAPWNGSSVEVFFDLNNTRGGYNAGTGDYNDANTYQWAITYNASNIAEYHNATARTILASSKVTAGAGYTMEIEIPWANLGVPAPSAGALSGLDVAVDVANTAGTARDHEIAAYNAGFNPFDQTPAQWGGVQYDACNSYTATNTPVYSATAISTSTLTSSRTMTPTATYTLSPTPTAHPPYAVVGYCYTTTKASAASLTGNGGSINWSTDVPWSDLTVAADAFMIPNTDDSFSNGGAKNATLVNAAHAHGVRCVVSLGGAGQDTAFSTLCLPANRAAFATAVANLVTQYGYDGVDIDWETNTNQQADATVMMEAIYSAIKALPNSGLDNKPRTLSFTTVNYIQGIYNMTTLANYTDWCFFMGYDWYACPSLANGPLSNEQTEINGLTNGSIWSYPISKIVLGCPLYTNDYNTSNCTAAEYDALSILHLGTPGAYNNGWAEQAYTAPNGHAVYVDTAQSYCDKINWALGAGLMGIGMWDVGQALPSTDSAVSGIWSTIGGNAACLNLGPTATPSATSVCPVPGPNFGPNVIVFDPGMSSASIQSQIDGIYGAQAGNQFGGARYALLFKPGTYNNTVNVGYYTQALGLGQSPDDVLINGGVVSNAALSNGNATCNFWEGA
ncbi:MAG TPA: glycosyl hydrolase family 18 protein, partial [bacterium]|nr:glycosyl hydrolase family 18 protein [bacterium]